MIFIFLSWFNRTPIGVLVLKHWNNCAIAQRKAKQGNQHMHLTTTNMNMTKSDYEKILSYYKLPFANLSSNEIKRKAEDILATKLCKCIKSVEKKTGTQNAISLCTTSVFGKKGLKYFGMSCKGKAQLHAAARKGRKLTKTRKNVASIATK